MNDIRVQDVNTNNLKIPEIGFPENALTVVTGVSGCGKSSLVFDTLYAESYRRYVESLSSFARQYLKAMPRPKVGAIENLPPAIAVRQARSSGNSRSTVGTMTELVDLLRVLYTYYAQIICPTCKIQVRAHSPESVAEEVINKFQGNTALITAGFSHLKIRGSELKKSLMQQGFTRTLLDKKIVKLDQVKDGDIKNALVIVDRIQVDASAKSRLVEACSLALKLGNQRVAIYDDVEQEPSIFFGFLACPVCERKFLKPSMALFSFNHPLGACKSCQGFGAETVVDWEKVFPDKGLSIKQKGVVPWNWGSFAACYRDVEKAASLRNFSTSKKFSDFTDQEWQWLKFGDGKKFAGVSGFLAWVESHRHKTHYRIHAARFRKYETCRECHGGRLNAEASACLVLGKNIAQVSNLNINALQKWIATLRVGSNIDNSATRLREGLMGCGEAFEELEARMAYLHRVGLGYLALDRKTRTLSGGEQQRINMARCLGSALTSTLYCLDEPSSGLHARDSHNLLEVLKELRDQGNSVVVVEHDRAIIDGADYIVEMGPGAGHLGGQVTYSGVSALAKVDSKIHEEPARFQKKQKSEFIQIVGVKTHNLKNISVRIPVGFMTVVCGVSGSGKTSLIQHSFYPCVAKILKSSIEGLIDDCQVESVGPRQLIERHARVIHVSQSSIGRSSRSNIATYLGVFEMIRTLFASTPEAKVGGLTAGSFSFNTSGGRCETCRGLGTVSEDLSFLGEMDVVCNSCGGNRFSQAVLDIKVRGKNLIEILSMTVAELAELFYDQRKIFSSLQRVMEMGLGYLVVGQSTSSFSGGEAQRLKLLRLLDETTDGKPSILIFDEPTTGLSDKDVWQLLTQFRSLTSVGHTVIIVEHHLGVIGAADWLIEIGPEAAENGGDLVFEGEVKNLEFNPTSLTAPYLFRRRTVK